MMLPASLMTTSCRLAAALICSVLLLSVSACDDSSNIGLNPGNDSLQGGRPVFLSASPGQVEAPAADRPLPITGDSVISRPWRVLVGRVNDPLTGTLVTHGYVDLGLQPSIPDLLDSAEPSEVTASLELVRTYVHGDTTGTMTVELYDLTEEAAMHDAKADASFPSESTPIDTYTINVEDSLTTLSLPQSWVNEHLEVLRDTSDGGDAFRRNFHGFKLVPQDADAVVGFNRRSAEGTIRLELNVEGTDAASALFGSGKAFSHIERTQPPADGALPPNRRVLVSGLGEGISFSFSDLTSRFETLRNAAVNRASMSMRVDTARLQRGPTPTFRRPVGDVEYRFEGALADGADCGGLREAITLENNRCAIPNRSAAAPDSFFVSNGVALPIFQRELQRDLPAGPLFTSFSVDVVDGPTQNFDVQTGSLPARGQPSTAPLVIAVPTADDEPNPSLPPLRARLYVTPL
jgi:hypothetical protein